jgi:predicted Zn-dependent peptidase
MLTLLRRSVTLTQRQIQDAYMPRAVGTGFSRYYASTASEDREGGLDSLERPPWLWRKLQGWLGFEVPLTTALPQVPLPTPSAPVPHPSGCRVSSLTNGVRIVTPVNASARAHSANDLVTSFGVYFYAGSRHEDQHTAGSTHALEALAFRSSTLEHSRFRIAQEIERTGGSVGCAAARESLAFTGECMREMAPALISLVCEAAVRPQIVAYGETSAALDDAIRAELQDALKVIEYEQDQTMGKDSQLQLVETLHATAYQGNTLGKFFR